MKDFQSLMSLKCSLVTVPSDLSLWQSCLILLRYVLQIESHNNNLEMQSVNNKALIEELDKLLECLRIPYEVLLLSV